MSDRGRIADQSDVAFDRVWPWASTADAYNGVLHRSSSGAIDRERGQSLQLTYRSERMSSETSRLEGDKSLLTGIRFYPSSSTNEVKIGEFKDEDDEREYEYQLRQPLGLDPTAIFKKVTEEETNKLAPEQNITLFALRLALIEKSASGIGTLSFIWASTIILGGFASNINPVDFLVITIILVTEGTRIFSRSRELEWQHLASKSTDTSPNDYSSKRMKIGRRFLGRNHSKDEPTPASEPPGSEPEPEPAPQVVAYRGASDDSQEDLENSVGPGQVKKLQPMIQKCLSSIRVWTDKPAAGVERKKRSIQPLEVEDLEEGSSTGMYPRNSPIPPRPNYETMKSSATKSKDPSEKDQKSVLSSVDATDIKRTWSSQLVPMLPGGFSFILSSRGVSAILYYVQVTSAIICLVLSAWRLSRQGFNPPAIQRQDTPVNLYTSLNIFYTLSLTEALLFLLERAYWEYKMNYEQLMLQVNNRAGLGEENQEMMKQFFYEVYKKCIDGSVFDGLDMDLVEYSLTLLQSDNSYEHLGGLRVLRKIADRYDGFSADALRRIGTAPGVIERLVEMLSWRSPHEEEIRQEVAALICRVVRYSKNCFRIAAVPGSMEGIVSLLNRPERDRIIVAAASLNKQFDPLASAYAVDLRLNGLRILVAQARDQVNLLKIGETRGLVPILISFIMVKDVHRFKTMEGTELKTFKKVLRLLAMLAAARNVSGTILRPAIARVVSGIASMRDVLEFGDCHPQLQWMAIEILTNLALDDDIRRAIGSTGGVIRNLFTLYIKNLDGSGALFATEESRKIEKAVSKRAGDALNLLAIQNSRNCWRMMELQDVNGRRTFIPALIGLLDEHREQTVCSAKILRSLMEYGDHSQKREISFCSLRVMRLVMQSPSQKMQEAVVGLAPRVLAALDEASYNQVFENVDRTELVQKLLRNLILNSQASSRFPRTRRHSLEFILALVKRDPIFLEEFMKDGLLESHLMQTLDSICEAENFVIFSGAEGLTRHSIAMEDLVQRSLQELRILVQEQDKDRSETLKLNTPQYP